ncbi:1-acyl-sn-glycerol-3-phosphate acyltransferase [Entamoeba marina]
MSVFLQITFCVSLAVICSPIYYLYRPLYQWMFQRVSETYMMFYPIMFYYYCGNRIVETGDELEINENALLLLNHTHFYDFLPIVLSAPRCGRIGAMRFFMKDEIRKIPFVGFGFWLMDNIYLKRSFAEDAPYILETFKRFRNKYYPFWLTIFPEGTRNKPHKLIQSQEFCSQNNLPILKNLLNPRPTGVIVALEQLRNVVPYVYDITLGYPIKPSPACCFCFNEGITIHMNIRKIETKDIPKDPEEIKTWLNDIWIEKDELMNYFKEHNHFPGDGRTPPFSFTWADFTGYMTPECFTKP